MPTDHDTALLAAKSHLAGLHVIRALQILIDLTSHKDFNPDQLRVPEGEPGGGQWTSSDGSNDGATDDDPLQTPSIGDDSEQPQDVANRPRAAVGPRPSASPAQETRLEIARQWANDAVRQVRELDPDWRRPDTISGGVENDILNAEATARAANARYNEIVRDQIPGANPSWGVNRLRKELYDQGYIYQKPTDSAGAQYINPETGAEVRIMERPGFSTDRTPREKYYFQYYYRYRSGQDQGKGSAIPIPDKN